MGNLVKVTWGSDTRIIPNYGEAEYGKEISVPEDMAESFKKQGLLMKNKSRKLTNEEAE